jgi:Bacterial SH3 domain
VKRLLLFVCIVGAAVYLLAPASRPTDGTLEAVSAVQTQTNQQIRRPLSSSWGSTLRSLRGDQEAAWVSPQPPTSLEPLGSEPTPHVEMQGSRLTRVTQYAVQPDQVSVTTDETERDAVKWVRMTQDVRVRSEASVSFPGLQFYPAGSKAQIVGRKNGWVEVLDPTTNERGWVYHSYLASIDAPGAANPEADSNVPPAKVASPTSPKSTPTAKSTVRTATVTKAKRRHERQAWRAERRRGLGLFKRRQAQRAWSLGPAR